METKKKEEGMAIRQDIKELNLLLTDINDLTAHWTVSPALKEMIKAFCEEKAEIILNVVLGSPDHAKLRSAINEADTVRGFLKWHRATGKSLRQKPNGKGEDASTG